MGKARTRYHIKARVAVCTLLLCLPFWSWCQSEISINTGNKLCYLVWEGKLVDTLEQSKFLLQSEQEEYNITLYCDSAKSRGSALLSCPISKQCSFDLIGNGQDLSLLPATEKKLLEAKGVVWDSLIHPKEKITALENRYFKAIYGDAAACYPPMNSGDFEELFEEAKGKYFSKQKLKYLCEQVEGSCIMVNQLNEMLSLFDFDEHKLELVKCALDKILDKDALGSIEANFILDSSKEEMTLLIEKHKN